MLNFQKLKEIINNNNSFIITTHVNPDADAIGSALAVYSVIKMFNKEASIINHSNTPENIRFLDKNNVVEVFEFEKHDELINNCDVLITVDINDLKRTVSMLTTLEKFKGIKVCIDHHDYAPGFEDYSFIDISYSSTGAIVYDFIKSLGKVTITKEIAEYIYAAIMTDTGSFRFERTTSGTHKIIADLLDAGVDPKFIYEQIYEQNNFERTKLLGEVLSSLKLNSTNEICYMIISQDMLVRHKTREEDVEGFVNHGLSIKGVNMAILFFELKDGVKISFRSRNSIAVNLLARHFDGGGHFHAAGARLFDVTLEDTINKVLEKAEEYLK
ncbi:MAG: bifunctional oligoribonuclease/PAP phosphatase NrnA [Melioribacteraceae bacterium]|nr:bifunctional oligoribonuclease/PAP phosphatase NrnA [Melioribacteraceae bacterium]